MHFLFAGDEGGDEDKNRYDAKLTHFSYAKIGKPFEP
ncbi:MAG: hypothetical protein K0Q79_1356 [Flavipsychrobacter sp.]|jgi:hypothetical protein|nr:hypothetical protein [Flavipsychrobacter sp.]